MFTCHLSRETKQKESVKLNHCLNAWEFVSWLAAVYASWSTNSSSVMTMKCSVSCAAEPLVQSSSEPFPFVYSHISTLFNLQKDWTVFLQDVESWGRGKLGLGQGGDGEGGEEGEGQTWSSMGKTRRVPRLSSSCSRESSSRSSASSEVLPLRFPFTVQPELPAASAPPPDAPLAVMAVSPNMKVRSPSLWMRSESGSFSCSWFWKHIHSGTWGEGWQTWGWQACMQDTRCRCMRCEQMNRLTLTVQRLIRDTMGSQK